MGFASLKKKAETFSKVVVPFCTFMSNFSVSIAPQSQQCLVPTGVLLLILAIQMGKVVPHCDFNLHCPKD